MLLRDCLPLFIYERCTKDGQNRTMIWIYFGGPDVAFGTPTAFKNHSSTYLHISSSKVIRLLSKTPGQIVQEFNNFLEATWYFLQEGSPKDNSDKHQVKLSPRAPTLQPLGTWGWNSHCLQHELCQLRRHCCHHRSLVGLLQQLGTMLPLFGVTCIK